MTTRRFLLPLSVVALMAGLKAQTPPAAPAATPTPAPTAPANTPAAAPAAATTKSAPATTPMAQPAPGLTKEQALKEIDAGLARFEVAVNAETSPVLQAAMKTRLTVLRQRREELAKTYTPGRFRALQASLLQEVRVEDRMTPSLDPNEGRSRRPITLDAAVDAATRDADRLLALDAARREEQSRTDRAEEEASRRRMEVARINADLSRLSAQIDAATVGDPNRRAELNMRLRDLEQERTRLEMSAQPSSFDTLRADIQREADRAR